MTDSNEIQIADKAFTWRDGRHWFDAGIVLFKQVKNHWYLICLLFAVVVALISQVAVNMVHVVVVFTSPLITAFMMNACHKSTNNELSHGVSLWQSISSHLNALMLLGVISAVLSVMTHYVHIQMLQVFGLSVELTQEMVEVMTGREALLRTVINVVINLPIALALAFSPALILFKRCQPIKAIKYSVLGVIKSWKSFS